jgi:hypothetical protein
MRLGRLALCAALFLGVTPARALELVLDQPAPVVAGQPASFRAEVTGAVGAVSYAWSFGDCVSDCSPPVTPDTQPAHVYASVGHYSVGVVATDESGARKGSSAIVTVHGELTPAAPRHSSNILYDPTLKRVWNVNQDNDTVTVSDAAGLAGLFQVGVGEQPRMLALASDGSVWVTNQRSDEIVVLAPDSGAELGRIPLPYASQPHAIAFSPATGLAYVTLFARGSVIEIDPASRSITNEVALGPTPAGIAISHDSRLFITRFLSPEDHGEIWELESQPLRLVRTIELVADAGQDDGNPDTVEDPDSESAGRGVPNYVFQMVISPDGTQGWALAKKDNTARGPQRDGRSMTSDTFARSIVCVIDLETSRERLDRRVDADNRSLPVAVVFSALGDYGYVLFQGNDFVAVYDAYQSSQHIGGVRDAGAAPDGLVLLPDQRLFINGYLSRDLIVYDLSRSIERGDHQLAEPVATLTAADEALDAEVIAGKRIFYNAADTRMNDHGYMSCAVCHYGGLHDGRVWDFTDRGEGLRNTKSLLGNPGTGRLHWSANFDEIQDFERDIRESMGGTGFMSDEQWLMHADDPLGVSSAGVSPELDALAAYVGSLDQVGRSPFRNPDGSYTAAALAGKKTFEASGCQQCHAEPALTDSPGGTLHDVGTLEATSGMRLHGPLTGLDTPTLKGLWQTAPYLHDGRAASLTELFTEHVSFGLAPNTSEQQIAELASYLEELDSEPAPEERPEPGPSGCSLSKRPRRSGTVLILALASFVLVSRARRFSCGNGRAGRHIRTTRAPGRAPSQRRACH